MKKGFTLIELLIVIAILAVLGVTVTLVLNPAELLRQGRDSTRISDLSSINSVPHMEMIRNRQKPFFPLNTNRSGSFDILKT